MSDASEAIEEIQEAASDAQQVFPLGNFRLVIKGDKVFLLNGEDKAEWSCNVPSLDSHQNKKQLSERTQQSDAEVDKVSAQLLFSLEQEHEDQESRQIRAELNSVGQDLSLSEEELNRKGLEFLKSGDLLYKVKKINDEGVLLGSKYRFVLGEDDTKLQTFENCVSCASRWPQNEFVSGTSGFGKSNMVLVALCLLPQSWVKILTYVTPAALRYSPNQSYKLLFIREHRRTGEQDIRLIKAEDGGYTYEIAIRDPETGQMTTQTGKIDIKSVITTSTSMESLENLRRDWLMSVDESPELTREINHRKAEYAAGRIEPVANEELAVIQHAVAQLDPKLDVIIPYADCLEDLTAWDRSRFEDLLEAISITAWIHQKQRPLDHQGRVIATAADLYLTLRTAVGTLLQSLRRLPLRLEKCLDVIPDTSESSGITAKEAALKRGVGQSTIRGYLADLENIGYVVSDAKQGTRERQYWRVPSPTIGTAEVLLKKVFQQSKWPKIVDSVKKALNSADPLTAELLNGVWTVVDPLAGTVVRLDGEHVEIPRSALQQMKKDTDSSPSSEKESGMNDLPAESAVQQEISSYAKDDHFDLSVEVLEHYRDSHWPQLDYYAEDYAEANDVTKDEAMELFRRAVQAGVMGQGDDGLFHVLLKQDDLKARLGVGADSKEESAGGAK